MGFDIELEMTIDDASCETHFSEPDIVTTGEYPFAGTYPFVVVTYYECDNCIYESRQGYDAPCRDCSECSHSTRCYYVPAES